MQRHHTTVLTDGLMVRITADDQGHVVTLTGSLDGRTAPALDKALASLPCDAGRVTVSLRHLVAIDDDGVATLLRIRQTLRTTGRVVELAGAHLTPRTRVPVPA